MNEIEVYLNDQGQSWELQADGEYIEQRSELDVHEDVQVRLLKQLAQV